MATDITLFSNVPAHLQHTELSETTKALMGNANSVKRISIKGGVFRLVAGGKELSQIEERHLDVIIVRAAPAVSRQFYAGAYDPEAQPVPPDCWSNDGKLPDPSSKNKQCTNCAACPQNVAGSGRGDSRACRFQQRLAVMLPDDMDSGVYQLTLPAASIFGKAEGDKRPLKDYVTYLAAQTRPVNVDTLVTRMKFDTKAESPKLFFSPVRWLDDSEYAEAREIGETDEAKRAVTMTVFGADSSAVVPPAPLEIEGKRPAVEEPAAEAVAEKPRRGRPPKAKPEVESAGAPDTAGDEVASDEPEKRQPAAKVNAVKPTPSKLADVVAEWDDE